MSGRVTQKNLIERFNAIADDVMLPVIDKINFIAREKKPNRAILEVWIHNMANHLTVGFCHAGGRRVVELLTPKVHKWIEMGVKNSLLALCQVMAKHGYRRGLSVWDSIPEK